MRSLWKGAISFGLVSIAVRLYTATDEHDFRLHQVHEADQGRIRYKKVCSVCGEEVPYDQIAKAYEMEDGRMVVLDQAELSNLPVSTDRAIDVLEFVDGADVDPIFFQKSYYVEPDPAAERPYVLLRQALIDSGKMAMVKITLRQRESLAMLRAREDVLVLHTMMWPDEIRKPEFAFLQKDIGVRKNELAMAESLVETMSGDFEPEEFHDDYRDAMAALIEAKAEGAELPEAEEPKESAQVVDLMTALQRSIDRSKPKAVGAGKAADQETDADSDTGKGADTEPDAKPARKSPAKKSTAKAAPAKSKKASAAEADADTDADADAAETSAGDTSAGKKPAAKKAAPAKTAAAKKSSPRKRSA
ncbi:Ku protein [Rhodococcus sp. X156]|uniref:non-homologous end joining protein Ku n=1 Tax=Rhodococcus sp. X156 TaxID=2499145 RepID=UPI000FDCB8E9|nr:Ku protein [Rhodococcus sp. X156]